MAEDDNGTPLGSITIDGVRIDQIGLHELRGNIAIIPQDPFLLAGTLRFNIDPKNIYTDEQIVKSLEAVQVLDTISSADILQQKIKQLKERQKDKLKSMQKKQLKKMKKDFGTVENFTTSTVRFDDDPDIKRIQNEGVTNQDKLAFLLESKGSNLSIGQRQLICIARALVKNPKILLMDEATANIDQKTDSVIQNLIKNTLVETTVVTIAHRLITVIQYDKIIILEQGQKVEEGAPADLLDIDGGWFRRLVGDSGHGDSGATEEYLNKMRLAATDHTLDPANLFAE